MITFQQRFTIDDHNWVEAKENLPIFAYFGERAVMSPTEIGLLDDCVLRFNAIAVYIEHRFYGDSIPLGSMDKALADKRIRECLTIEQALADFKEILLSVRANYSAHQSPIIVVGGGYFGVLAAYFRMKYPEVAVGALASSAPLLSYGTNSTLGDGYCSAVSKNFKDVDPKCHNLVAQSWRKIDEMAAKPDGLDHLRQVFNTCRPLKSTEELKESLTTWYSLTAQYNNPENQWINKMCATIKATKGHIDGVAAAMIAPFGYGPNCVGNSLLGIHSPYDKITYAWQQCQGLALMVGCKETSMLPSLPFNLTEFKNSCRSRFGAEPNLNSIAKYFGSKDVKETLTKNGSNIMLSNGREDPLSTGGILRNISNCRGFCNHRRNSSAGSFFGTVRWPADMVRRAKKTRIAYI